mmetsp:Transcript_4073/g.12234  ORF Transcript_4073/g.12234 Transcript_4073/m.12234 type:complete len:370 (-) Transcript_4073:459-1568(-)
MSCITAAGLGDHRGHDDEHHTQNPVWPAKLDKLVGQDGAKDLVLVLELGIIQLFLQLLLVRIIVVLVVVVLEIIVILVGNIFKLLVVDVVLPVRIVLIVIAVAVAAAVAVCRWLLAGGAIGGAPVSSGVFGVTCCVVVPCNFFVQLGAVDVSLVRTSSPRLAVPGRFTSGNVCGFCVIRGLCVACGLHISCRQFFLLHHATACASADVRCHTGVHAVHADHLFPVCPDHVLGVGSAARNIGKKTSLRRAHSLRVEPALVVVLVELDFCNAGLLEVVQLGQGTVLEPYNPLVDIPAHLRPSQKSASRGGSVRSIEQDQRIRQNNKDCASRLSLVRLLLLHQNREQIVQRHLRSVHEQRSQRAALAQADRP